jgi:hypothetical protein
VAYETDNTIINIGTDTWPEASGAPCLWILDMFPPSAHATVIIPYDNRIPKAVTGDYFG